MNFLFSCIGKRGYIADYFRECIAPGDRIIGTSNTPWTPGFSHCDQSYVLPDIASDSYMDAVFEVCRRESINAVFSFFDPDTAKLSMHHQEFKAMGIIPVLPPTEVCHICFDKYRTFQFLEQKGFATAKTYVSLEAALDSLKNKEIQYPLFVKPRLGFGSRNTLLAKNERELEVFFHLEEQMLIQECLTGDPFNYDMLSDLDGNVVSVVVWKKLLSRLGETEQSITCKDEQLIHFGEKLGAALGNVGPLDADLFRKNGHIYVLELNLRFGGGYPTSHLAGANFPKLIIQMLRREKVSPQIGMFRDQVIMMKDNVVMGGPREDFFPSLGISSLRTNTEGTTNET